MMIPENRLDRVIIDGKFFILQRKAWQRLVRCQRIGALFFCSFSQAVPCFGHIAPLAAAVQKTLALIDHAANGHIVKNLRRIREQFGVAFASLHCQDDRVTLAFFQGVFAVEVDFMRAGVPVRTNAFFKQCTGRGGVLLDTLVYLVTHFRVGKTGSVLDLVQSFVVLGVKDISHLGFVLILRSTVPLRHHQIILIDHRRSGLCLFAVVEHITQRRQQTVVVVGNINIAVVDIVLFFAVSSPAFLFVKFSFG